MKALAGRFLLFWLITTLFISFSSSAAQDLSNEEKALIALLDKYKAKMPDIASKMLKAKDNETVRLGPDEERLINETAKFFNELLSKGKGTQAYQSLRGKLPNWKTDYLGIERALMMGRALIVQKVLKETLIQFYNDNPEAIGTIYGEMDIGTWVKMQTKTLQFDKDIDLSSLSTDDHLNEKLRDKFKENLQKITGVADEKIMINMDALITPHGKASAEVFIGEWGKTFAEMDLLARGKWKLIMLKLQDGSVISPDEAKRLRQQGKSIKVIDIQTKEMPGTQLFWWRAFLEGRDFEPPKVTINTEPMLSLEMLRHLIADIERGNYTGVDKLLKIMKYVERSYLYNQKATSEYRGEWDPFDDNDRVLGEFAVELTKAKQAKDASIEMAKVMDKYKEALNLEGLIKGDKDASDEVINKLIKRSKKLIIKNSEVALALRLRKIASETDEAKRNQDLDRMLEQMHEQLEVYKHHVGDYPEGRIKDIIWLSKKLREGDKWSPEVVRDTMDDLIKELSHENYKIDKGIIEYIFSAEDARQLRIYLRENMKWTEDRINKFIEDLRKKYPNLAKGYDRISSDIRNIDKDLPTFAKIHKKITEFNEEWSKTIEGSNFVKSLDFADNLITFLDAGLGEKDPRKGLIKVAGVYLKMKATGYLPSLQVAEGIMQAYEEGDIGPAIKSFAFYYFPTIGSLWGLGEKLQRLDLYVRDKEFLSNLDKMRSRIYFDIKTGHIIGIKTGKYSELFEFKYSPNQEERANNFADFFMKGDNLIGPSELPEFRYWMTLIPRDSSRYGYGSDWVRKGDEILEEAGKIWVGEKLGLGNMDISGKKAKYARLKKYFGNNEDLLTAVLILENANNAPRFTDLAGPKLAKKRDDVLKSLEEKVEREMWKSLFYLLEASATPPEEIKKLIEKLEKLEQDLSLSGTDLTDIRGMNNGLMKTIENEIKQQISKDYYGKFIYERYYNVYSRIKNIRSKIIQLWTEKYGINWERIISSPMKFILGGCKNCAPRLTLKLDKDLMKAEDALERHISMGRKIDADLLSALGHAPKTAEELEHRRNLAQIGFEIEHLFDDCPERSIQSCSEDIRDLITKRLREYRQYLSGLKTQSCTYTYSEWSQCDPITKKQTRRVISKEPKDCIEKERPVLERPCEPERQPCTYTYSEWSQCDPKSGKRTRKVVSKEPKDCVEKNPPVLEEPCISTIKDEEKERSERERLEKERLEREREERERKEAERKKAEEKKKEPPTCSYEYSDWGECDRATKKQTRTVIAKKPEGCVEREKPVLEQGCTPPPTEEEEKRRYFNCLCRCSSTWDVEIGVLYDPEGKYIPECKSSGPCIGGLGAFGCTKRHFFGSATTECAKRCWESYFGKGTFDPNKAERMRKEENKKFAKPLSVKIKASKNPADFGDIVDLTAETIGGTGGYKWSWSGCAQDAKDATAKVINTRTCKTCTASVTVTDQDGNTASDSLLIQCNNLKVKLTKESPKENKIPLGGRATFLAEVFSGDKLYSGPTLSYLWERNPDVLFGDPKNPQYELKGGSQMRNTAIFRKTGTTPVWVVVRREIDGVWRTVGESEQIQIEVVNPELIIKATPEKPMVGQEVKLEVSTNPPMGDDLVSFWWDIPGYFSGTGNKATFKPKDTKPIKGVVHAKSKDSGEEIGTKEIIITAQGYQVSISEPRYHGPKPRIWKCDTQLGGACPGLVEVEDTQFAVFRDIFLKATVTPTPDSPRYKWTVEPSGSCGLPGSGSEIRINCSSTGTYTVRVEVTNADGVKLGEASRTVTVSISDEMLKVSDRAKEAYEKIQKAKSLINEGKLDEAIKLANEATTLDPKNTEAKTLKDKWIKDKEQIVKHLDNINKLIKEKRFQEAEKELQGAKALHPKYVKVIEAEKTLNEAKQRHQKEVTDRLNEAKRLAKEGKIDDAVKAVQESAKIDKVASQPVMNEISLVVKKAGWDALGKGDYKTAIKRLEQAVALNPADADAQNKLKGAKDYEAKMPQVEAKMKEFERLIQEKRIVSSYKKILEIQDILRTMAMGQSANNPVIIKYNEEYNKLNKWYNEFIQKSKAELQKLMENKEWLKAEALIMDVLKYELTDASEAHFKAILQTVQRRLSERREALRYYEYAKSRYDRGEPATAEEAMNIKRELESKLDIFKKDEPEFRQFVELIHNFDKRRKAILAVQFAQSSFASGDVFYRAYQFDRAAVEYEEGLKHLREFADLKPQLYTEYYKKWEDAVGKDRRYRQIVNELNLLLKKPSLDEFSIKEGIKLAEEGLKIVPNSSEVNQALSHLRHKLSEIQRQREIEAQKKAKADQLWQDCIDLSKQNRLNEALAKCRESLNYWENDKRKEAFSKLQSELHNQAQRKAQADKLWNDCIAMAQQNRLNEALTLCEQSLNFWTSDKRVEAVGELKKKVQQSNEEAQKKAMADRLWEACINLSKENRLNEALEKCKESLNYWSSENRRQAVAKLENEILQKTSQTINQGNINYVKNFAGKWQTNWGLMELKVIGNRIVGNYTHDNGRIEAILSPDGRTMEGTWSEAPTYKPPKDAGKVILILSEDGNSIKGRWGYGDSLSGGEWTGTRIKDTQVSPPTINISGVTNGQVIFEDNFDTENNGKGVFNYNSFSKWKVKDGTVDLIGNGFYDYIPGRGLYVDLDGSSMRSGIFETKQVFQLQPGQYVLSFDLAGSQRGDTNTVTVKLGNVFHENITLASNEPMKTIKRVINVSSTTSGTLSFRNSGGDNYGLLLDNVRLVRVSSSEAGRESAFTQVGKGGLIFNNGNIAGVSNNPTRPTTFTINQPHVITLIQNYHWNNARGATPGTIALKDHSGRIYGPWQAKGSPGQGGVPNAYWTVYPNITLPAGTYTVIDSDPLTWSQNSGSNGAGFTRIEGYPVSTQANITGGTSSAITTSRTLQVRLKNNSNQNVHLYPEGEFPSPNNRIIPGETRTVIIPIPSDGFLRFCAGRNGQTIQCNKKAIDPNDQRRTYTVIFDEANPFNKVIIHTGLK